MAIFNSKLLVYQRVRIRSQEYRIPNLKKQINTLYFSREAMDFGVSIVIFHADKLMCETEYSKHGPGFRKPTQGSKDPISRFSWRVGCVPRPSEKHGAKHEGRCGWLEIKHGKSIRACLTYLEMICLLNMMSN